MDKTDAVMLVVVLARFGLPFLIPRFPLPAILACLVLDAADQTIFQLFTDAPLTGYQSYDKALDIFYLAVAFISTFRNWTLPLALVVAQFLYFYRLLGVVLFETLEYRWLLLVFPNTFEYFFIAIEAVRTRWSLQRMSTKAIYGTAAFIWIVIKLPQEYWIHIAKMDVTDTLRDHPWTWGVLVGLVALGLGILVFLWKIAPTPDTRFALDVRKQFGGVSSRPGVRLLERSEVIEKIFLIGMIAVIFGHVLPDVRASGWGIFGVVAIFVVLNAVVSFAWRFREADLVGVAAQLIFTLALNLGIVGVYFLVTPTRDERAPVTNTLFYLVLLSVLIALYDYYRRFRHPMRAGN